MAGLVNTQEACTATGTQLLSQAQTPDCSCITCQGGWRKGPSGGQLKGVQDFGGPPDFPLGLSPHQCATCICIAVCPSKSDNLAHLQCKQLLDEWLKL